LVFLPGYLGAFAVGTAFRLPFAFAARAAVRLPFAFATLAAVSPFFAPAPIRLLGRLPFTP
jgi:hypothetical protein